ncbi:hypothetical protein ACOJTA_12640 [Malaciobacter sp. WC5094]
MKKILFILCIYLISLQADGLSRFIDVKEYKSLSDTNKKYYIRGSYDMLEVQLKNRFGNNNKITKCTDKINSISDYVNLYDNFLNKIGNKYNAYSASEIFTLALVEYCKKQ